MTFTGHDFPDGPGSWFCRLCGCRADSVDAKLACIGSAAEPPEDTIAPADVDWGAITKEISE